MVLDDLERAVTALRKTVNRKPKVKSFVDELCSHLILFVSSAKLITGSINHFISTRIRQPLQIFMLSRISSAR
jgi:hypothetical protein